MSIERHFRSTPNRPMKNINSVDETTQKHLILNIIYLKIFKTLDNNNYIITVRVEIIF